MHTRWQEMSDREAQIFFHEQKLFSKERFEEERMRLEWQDLSFYTGHRLVRAHLSPQRVELDRPNEKGALSLDREHRTLFLYNPDTDDLLTKVIPLTTTSTSVYLANKLLSLRLGPTTVVDYVKFFGLVVEGDEGPFYFLTDVDEVPWDPDATERDKIEMRGRFSAVVDLSVDGHVNTHTQIKKDFLGKSFTLSMLCIHAQHCFAVKMHVSSSGYIRMEDDRGIAEDCFPAQTSPLPYYRVEPTGALRQWLNKQERRTKALVFGIILPIVLVFMVAGVAGAIGSVAVMGDVLIGSVWPSFSASLNGLVARDWLLWLFLLGAFSNLLFALFQLVFLRFAEFVAARRPIALFDTVIEQIRNQLAKKYGTARRLIRSILLVTVVGAASAFTAWALIFVALQNLSITVFDGVVSPIALRTGFGALLDETLNWLMRGEAPIVVGGPIRQFFDYEGSLSDAGRALLFAVGFSIPFVIGEQVRRLLRYRHQPA